MKTQIRVKENGQVYRSDWSKVEALPVGGPYADRHNGFTDHIDESGKVYRVTFPTFLTGKKVNMAN